MATKSQAKEATQVTVAVQEVEQQVTIPSFLELYQVSTVSDGQAWSSLVKKVWNMQDAALCGELLQSEEEKFCDKLGIRFATRTIEKKDKKTGKLVKKDKGYEKKDKEGNVTFKYRTFLADRGLKGYLSAKSVVINAIGKSVPLVVLDILGGPIFDATLEPVPRAKTEVEKDLKGEKNKAEDKSPQEKAEELAGKLVELLNQIEDNIDRDVAVSEACAIIKTGTR